MNFSADRLIENLKLKKSLLLWKTLFLLLLIGTLLFCFKSSNVISVPITYDYVGRISINGFIGENLERDRRILDLRDDNSLKALIVHVNSPGGTVTGGETLYNALHAVSKVKPIVIVMDGVAASGGYMISLAGDHIVAHNGTITGSVGVIWQALDLSEISKKYGVGFNVVRSGDLKSVPSSIFEKLSDDGRKSLQESMGFAYDYFLSMVLDKRKITDPKTIGLISTGKIFVGKQALEVGLIDEIGDEESAIKWLAESKNITSRVKDVRLSSSRLNFPAGVGKSNLKRDLITHYLEGQGILAILPGYINGDLLVSTVINE